MNNLVFLVSILLASVSQCGGLVQTPVINTTLGPVQGAILQTVWNNVNYSSFKGIPYGAPPIGILRFQPPEAAPKWTDVLNVTQEGHPCPQINFITDEYIGNEDCLHLSVFTPETNFGGNTTLLPVMIWIYGGSFCRGYVNTELYGPDFFIEQNIIVVSISYRLGALGFLYLNNAGAMGNAALKDQVLAMKWVQDNIVAFGGDPKRVTLFGVSAGASAVLLHHLSDRSKDLFHRSISQSGSPLFLLFSTPVRALTNAHRIAAAFGVDNMDTNLVLRSLREISAKRIVYATYYLDYPIPDHITMPFQPTIENAAIVSPQETFLSECPITLFMTGNFKKCEKILGYTTNEFLAFTRTIVKIANYTFVPREWIYHIIKKGAQRVSSVTMVAGIDYTQRLLVENNDDFSVYYYVLSYASKYSMHAANGIPIEDAAHFDDVGLLFNANAMNAPTDPKAPINRFRYKFVSLWANFAKYGNPTPRSNNPIGGVVWQPSGKLGLQLKINDKFKMIPRSISNKALIMESFFYFKGPITSGCSNISYAVFYTNLFP